MEGEEERVNLYSQSGLENSNSVSFKPIDGYAKNPHFQQMSEDYLYHFGIGTNTHDFQIMFGDIKFVCMGGSPNRMERFARHLLEEMGFRLPAGQGLTNIACNTDRFVMYKVGPVLAVSHGMGVPSLSIMLHELVKLIDHAGCQDVTFVRIGTSGGLGVKPGTIVISDGAVDGIFQAHQELRVMGKKVIRPAILDKDLADELFELANQFKDFDVIRGKTMCLDGFYEEQGRTDGAICDYEIADKQAFLRDAYNKGVRNIEMESIGFAAFCHHLKIKGAIMAVTLVDRFVEDQCRVSKDELEGWELRLVKILSKFVVKRMERDQLKPICSCLISPSLLQNRKRGSRRSRR